MLDLDSMRGVNFNSAVDAEDDARKMDTNVDSTGQSSSLYTAMQMLLASHAANSLHKQLLTVPETTKTSRSFDFSKPKKFSSPSSHYPLDSLPNRSASATSLPSDGYSPFYEKSQCYQQGYPRYDEGTGASVANDRDFILRRSSLSADYDKRSANTFSPSIPESLPVSSSSRFLTPDFFLDEKKDAFPMMPRLSFYWEEDTDVYKNVKAVPPASYCDHSAGSLIDFFGETKYEAMTEEMLLEKLISVMSIDGVVSSNKIGSNEQKLLKEYHLRLIKRYKDKLRFLQENITLLCQGGEVHFDIASEIFSLYPQKDNKLLEHDGGAVSNSSLLPPAPLRANSMPYSKSMGLKENSNQVISPAPWLDDLLASPNNDTSATQEYGVSKVLPDPQPSVSVITVSDELKNHVSATPTNGENISREEDGLSPKNDSSMPIRRLCTTPANAHSLDIKSDDIRSILHSQGCCKPCAFFYNKKKGCRNGDTCEFCHHEDHGKHTLKHWKKQQQKMLVSVRSVKASEVHGHESRIRNETLGSREQYFLEQPPPPMFSKNSLLPPNDHTLGLASSEPANFGFMNEKHDHTPYSAIMQLINSYAENN